MEQGTIEVLNIMIKARDVVSASVRIGPGAPYTETKRSQKMKDYSDKYTFIHYTDKNGQPITLALSTYEGKTVKGKAICDSSDAYSEQAGKDLAAARCNEAVAAKRAKRAKRKLLEAQAQFEEAQAHLMRMTNYYADATKDHSDASRMVCDILNTL